MRKNQKAIAFLVTAILASTFFATLNAGRAAVTWGVKVGDAWSYETKTADGSAVIYYKMTVKTVADTGPTGDIWSCVAGNQKTVSDTSLAAYVSPKETMDLWLAGTGKTESREYGGKTITAVVYDHPVQGVIVYDYATGILLEISNTVDGVTYTGKLYSFTGETPECKADIPGFPVWIVGVFGLAAVLAILKKHRK